MPVNGVCDICGEFFDESMWFNCKVWLCLDCEDTVLGLKGAEAEKEILEKINKSIKEKEALKMKPRGLKK